MSESTALSTNVRPQDLIFRRSNSAADMVPAHIAEAQAEEGREGVDALKRYVRPARVKVCQSNRTGALKSFKEGAVILTPANLLVADVNEPFYFVPILFFPEYLTINPWALKSTLPFIRERSLDDMGEIAIKSRDKDKRNADICPEDPSGKLTLRHVESLTFLCVIVGTPMVCAMSFQRGEYRVGAQLASQISMRGGPIYSMVFEGRVPPEKRKNDQGEWYGIDVMAPTGDDAPSPWVQSPEEFVKLRDMHREYKKILQDQLLVVDHDYDDDTDNAAPNEAASTI